MNPSPFEFDLNSYSLHHTSFRTGRLPTCLTACLSASLTARLTERSTVYTSSSAGCSVSSEIVRMPSWATCGKLTASFFHFPCGSPCAPRYGRNRLFPKCCFEGLNTVAAYSTSSPDDVSRAEGPSLVPPAARRLGGTAQAGVEGACASYALRRCRNTETPATR